MFFKKNFDYINSLFVDRQIIIRNNNKVTSLNCYRHYQLFLAIIFTSIALFVVNKFIYITSKIKDIVVAESELQKMVNTNWHIMRKLDYIKQEFDYFSRYFDDISPSKDDFAGYDVVDDSGDLESEAESEYYVEDLNSNTGGGGDDGSVYDHLSNSKVYKHYIKPVSNLAYKTINQASKYIKNTVSVNDVVQLVNDFEKELENSVAKLFNKANIRVVKLTKILNSTGIFDRYKAKNNFNYEGVTTFNKIFDEKCDSQIDFYHKNYSNYILKSSLLGNDKLRVNFGDMKGRLDYLASLEKIVTSLPIKNKPIKNGVITSKFGFRKDPFHRRTSFHGGLDIYSRSSKAYIKSMNSGLVIRSGDYSNGYGNYVEINHGNGLVTRYAHMNKTLVKTGEFVRSGQVIGIEGSTGRAAGPHLHLEVLYYGSKLNPLEFLKLIN